MVRVLVAALVLLAAFVLYRNSGGGREEPGVVPASQRQALEKAEDVENRLREMQERREEEMRRGTE